MSDDRCIVTDAEAKRWKGYATIGDDMLRLLADRDVAMEMIQGLYLSLLHAPPPEKAHEGACHPDAGCDGLCAAAYSYDMLLEKARALITAVRGEER